jgi:hypothetical protein
MEANTHRHGIHYNQTAGFGEDYACPKLGRVPKVGYRIPGGEEKQGG